MTKHTLSVLVENKPGVLARVAGLFSRRGFNIDSLAVGETEQAEISRITIVVNADDSPLEQVTKQLNKLVNVLKIVELEAAASVQRELLLVKVRADRPYVQVLETANSSGPASLTCRRTPSPSRRPGRPRSSTRSCATSNRSESRKWCSPAWWRSGGVRARSPRPFCARPPERPKQKATAWLQRCSTTTMPICR